MEICFDCFIWAPTARCFLVSSCVHFGNGQGVGRNQIDGHTPWSIDCWRSLKREMLLVGPVVAGIVRLDWKEIEQWKANENEGARKKKKKKTNKKSAYTL